MQQHGFDVRTASDTIAAEAILQQHTVDMVLLDWMLPKQTGVAWVKQLRHNPHFATLPVIMLSARIEEADQTKGLYAGADDYITKPFTTANLIARIHARLRKPHTNTIALLWRYEL